jgi:hypothetical protein
MTARFIALAMPEAAVSTASLRSSAWVSRWRKVRIPIRSGGFMVDAPGRDGEA